MSTNKQVAANRANSARSTGPTSIAGKAASSKNATSHGLCAAVLAVFHWESEYEFQQLRDDYLTRFRPIDRVERDLVDRLVDSTWRRNRILSIETALLELEIVRTDATVIETYDQSDDGRLRLALAFRERNGDRVWDAIGRYVSQTERSYHRAMRELETLQGERFPTPQSESPTVQEEEDPPATTAPPPPPPSARIHVITNRSQNPEPATPATPAQSAQTRGHDQGIDPNGPSEPGSTM